MHTEKHIFYRANAGYAQYNILAYWSLFASFFFFSQGSLLFCWSKFWQAGLSTEIFKLQNFVGDANEGVLKHIVKLLCNFSFLRKQDCLCIVVHLCHFFGLFVFVFVLWHFFSTKIFCWKIEKVRLFIHLPISLH